MALTLFAIALLAGLSFTVMSLVTINSRAAHLEYDAARAYYTARSGIAMAQEWISENSFIPVGGTIPAAMAHPSATVQTWAAGLPAPSGGTFSATIQCGPLLYPYFEQWWQVDVTGLYGNAARTLRAFVREESFARFAYFSQQEMPGDYWITGNSFQGPSHTNGHFSFWGNPSFNDRTTSSNADEMVGAGHSGYGYPFTPGVLGSGPQPTVAARYDTTLIGGYDAGGTQVFTDTSMFYHALGGDYPPAPGVASGSYPIPYVDPTTGIPSQNFTFAGGQPVISLPSSTTGLIQQAQPTRSYDGTQGDVTMTFSSTSSSGSVSVCQGTLQETWQTCGGSTFPVISVTNGNVYVEGTMHGKCTIICSGTAPTNDSTNYGDYMVDVAPRPNYPAQAGQVTSATTGLGTGNVVISNDVRYFDSSAASADALGLVANSNIVVAPAANPGNPDGTGNHQTVNPATGQTVDGVTVQASLMALHGIYMANDWWQGPQGQAAFRGQMFELGGLIAQTQTLFGIFDPGSGQIIYGYNENYQYDTRLAANPPPAFPGTGNVVIEGVEDLGALK